MDFCHLRKLALSNVQITDSNTTQICFIIKDARFLEELDLSWNQLTPHAMLRLTGTLAENRQLRTVNLSMNSLTTQRNRDYIDILEEEDIEDI